MRAVIIRYKITAFFTLAFTLSWLAWTPYVLSENGLGLWHYRFPELLGTSQLLGVLPGAYLGPIFAAFLVTALGEGRAGLRRWGGRVLRWRVGPRWYAGAVLGVSLVLVVASLPFSHGWEVPGFSVFAAYAAGLVLQMLTTGLAEEPGWRDFALPHLQPKYGPLRATLILGPLWGAWHLPLFLTEWGGGPDVSWTAPVEFCAATVTLSVVMTWVFNRSGESLPIAMLLHTSINNFFSTAWTTVFPGLDTGVVAHILLISSGAVAVVLMVATRGRLGYRVCSGDLVAAGS
ncbi:MAG TPA: CPBP family intramembrane glutamic endopeptidase [Amycolatopsis sp.]|nr:CPBP family intramembrane glutamic endopeptidase [Amycolatopsis sp.]